MIVTACARRLGVTAVGIVSVLAFTAGCSSSSAGKPVSATSKPAASTAAAGTTSAIPGGSTSTPVTLPSSLPALSGKDPFCKEFTNGDLAGIGAAGSSGDLSGVVKVWDKLASAAPDAIKADAKSVDEYLHSVVAGNPDVSKAQELSGAIGRITTWISSHCI